MRLQGQAGMQDTRRGRSRAELGHGAGGPSTHPTPPHCTPLRGLLAALRQGRVHVRAGSEGFPSDLGAWTYLATKALGMKPYTPDFDADIVSSGPCRVLRIKGEAFQAALRMAKADEIMGARAMKQVGFLSPCPHACHMRHACSAGCSRLGIA